MFFAQDTTYYDGAGAAVTDTSLAIEYKIVEYRGNSDTATVRTFFMSGKIQSEENYSDYSQKIRDGKTMWWNEDGQKIFEANYKLGTMDGDRIICNSNGEPLKNETYRDSAYGKGNVFTVVEEMPSFPGGEQALFKFLRDNIQYPKKARRKGITGKVYITFIVDKEGNIMDVKTVKGVSPELDAESVRVVKLMPRWKPGYQNGRPVNVQYNLPIIFTLKY